MDAKTWLEKLGYVGVLSFATVDRWGAPQVRCVSAVYYAPEALYFFTARGKDFCRELEREYRVLYGRNLTLSRLPEAVVLPLCPDKGTCLSYDPNLSPSVYLENDLEQLLRQNG